MKNMLISTPAVGRLWVIQSRTPMTHGPVSVPPELIRSLLESGVTVYKHDPEDPMNPEKKTELSMDELEGLLTDNSINSDGNGNTDGGDNDTQSTTKSSSKK